MLSAPLSSGGGAWSPCYLWGPGSQCEGISPPRPRRLSSHSHIPREGRLLPAAAPPMPCSQPEGRSRQPPHSASSAPPPRACEASPTFSRPRPPTWQRPIAGPHHTRCTLCAGHRTLKHAHARARAVGPRFRWGCPLHPDPALPNLAANAGRGPRPSARPPRATSLTQGLHGATRPAPALAIPGLLRPRPRAQPAQNSRLNCPVRPSSSAWPWLGVPGG